MGERKMKRFRNVLVALFGACALVIALPLTAQAAVGVSAPSVEPDSLTNCIGGDLCAYSNINGSGSKKAWYICQTVGRPFTTTGSVYNNQTATSLIYFTDGSVYHLLPGHYLVRLDWKTVNKMKTC
jgi:hypothetical protein